MKVYQSKPRITLSPAIRDGQKYVEVEFDEDDAIRLSLSKEKGVRFEGDRAYLPEEGFDLSGFFDRHVETAYINYSALKNPLPKKNGKTSPAIPPGYAETLRQLRYSEHTVRAYTAYFREFQQYFAGRNLRYIRPEEINAYIVHLIDTRGISSCQQNLRINSIKFYFEKVLGLERKCYEVKRAKRERTLPDVLSKEEIKSILDATGPDIRLFCMFSLLYSAGLRITELLDLKPRHQREPFADTGTAGQREERPLHAAVEAPCQEADRVHQAVQAAGMAVRAVQGRAVHGEHRVEEAERGGEGSRNHQAGVPPPVATLVRHASDRARHGFENRERAVGAQPTENDGNVRAYSRHFQEQHPHSIG